MSKHYPQCGDCAFENVEPAICDECRDGDQFEEAEVDSEAKTLPLYYYPLKEAA